MEQDPHQLEYAPGHASHRRTIHRAIFWLILLATASLLISVTPDLIRKVRLHSLQRQCLEYSASPESLVFDSRASTMPQLPPSDPQAKYISLGNGVTAFVRVPKIWSDYYASAGLSSYLFGNGMPYLHRMRSAAGHERLVAVGVVAMQLNGPEIELTSSVLVPASMTAAARDISWAQISQSFLLSKELGDIAVFAGQPDPEHLDHFSIQAIVKGEPWMIDGWLGDDDQLRLERRRPVLIPSVPPLPASSH